MATHAQQHDSSVAKPVLLEAPGAITSPKLDGADLHIGLVYTRQCWDIVEPLVTACRGELMLKGVARANIHELQVSLPFELPYATKRLVASAATMLDAVVVVGCMVQGATLSFEFVAEAVTRASMKIGMKMKTPVIYGVLTCTDVQQARACAGLTHEGKTRDYSYGVEWAQSAIEMAHLNKETLHAQAAKCACECHDKACVCADKNHAKAAHAGKHHEHTEKEKHKEKKEKHHEHHATKDDPSLTASVLHSLQEGECGECGCMGSDK